MEEESFFENLFNKKSDDDEVIQKKIEEYVDAEENQFLEKKEPGFLILKDLKKKVKRKRTKILLLKLLKL